MACSQRRTPSFPRRGALVAWIVFVTLVRVCLVVGVVDNLLSRRLGYSISASAPINVTEDASTSINADAEVVEAVASFLQVWCAQAASTRSSTCLLLSSSSCALVRAGPRVPHCVIF